MCDKKNIAKISVEELTAHVEAVKEMIRQASKKHHGQKTITYHFCFSEM